MFGCSIKDIPPLHYWFYSYDSTPQSDFCVHLLFIRRHGTYCRLKVLPLEKVDNAINKQKKRQVSASLSKQRC